MNIQIQDIMVNKICIYMITITLVFSCTEKSLRPNEYIKWIDNKENGLIQEEEYRNVRYIVSYKPTEYNLAKAILNQDSLLLKNQINNHTFIVKMEPIDGKTPVLLLEAQTKEEPFQRINYYFTEAPNYIKLIDGIDTISNNSYIYERLYNLTPNQSFVIGFEQKHQIGNQDIVLSLEDKVFNTGIINFRFKERVLKNLPKLIK